MRMDVIEHFVEDKGEPTTFMAPNLNPGYPEHDKS